MKLFVRIILFSSLAIVNGCAYLNGDAMWLSDGQKEVNITKRISTLGDVEYSFQEGNLPFCFNMVGSHEFGHIGHSMGCPDFSKGGYIVKDSFLRFSVNKPTSDVHVEFIISNGVVQAVGARGQGCRIERRKGPFPHDVEPINIDKKWCERALEKLVAVNVWSTGCSIQIHRLGEYGIVYNYSLPSTDDDGVTLCILGIKNLRWFHWPNL